MDIVANLPIVDECPGCLELAAGLNLTTFAPGPTPGKKDDDPLDAKPPTTPRRPSGDGRGRPRASSAASSGGKGRPPAAVGRGALPRREEAIGGLCDLTTVTFEREREFEKTKTLMRLNSGVPLAPGDRAEVARALQAPVGGDARALLAASPPVHATPIPDESAEQRALSTSREQSRSLETQLARALGQAAALVEWSDAKACYMQRQRARWSANAQLRSRLEELEGGSLGDDHRAPSSRAPSPFSHGEDASGVVEAERSDDDSDFGGSADAGARSSAAEVRRLERLLAEEKSAHRTSVRSLETQLMRMSSQLSKMQTWADDKFEHMERDAVEAKAKRRVVALDESQDEEIIIEPEP
ncbi:hypothetical protein SO694_00032041 [Aureococcus anophagefferens]|uniref:Uncharacterized protein n=1 Tax=Aureococcus anophagefferens TaxID=44056 RepID=A0ABR1FK82_AURAN